MGRNSRNRAHRCAGALVTVVAVVASLCGLAPAAAGATPSGGAVAPASVHVGARIPIVVDPSPAPATHVAATALRAQSAVSAFSSSSTIQVTYSGFSAPAQAAFQYAVNLWKPLISSPVPITVNASWSALGSGVLGQAGPDEVLRDQPGLVAHT